MRMIDLKATINRKMNKALDKANSYPKESLWHTHYMGKYLAYEDVYALLCDPSQDEDWSDTGEFVK